MRKFKFLREGLKSDYNGFQWTMGWWEKTECRELCIGFNCSESILDAFGYVKGEILAEVETRGTHFVGDDKSTWAEMMIVRAWEWGKKDSVLLAIFAAELIIDIFEKKYPDDKRPRQAIEAAKNWTKDPSAAKVASAAREAGAYCAASAASTGVYSAARAASVARETSAGTRRKINRWLIDHLEDMEEIK